MQWTQLEIDWDEINNHVVIQYLQRKQHISKRTTQFLSSVLCVCVVYLRSLVLFLFVFCREVNFHLLESWRSHMETNVRSHKVLHTQMHFDNVQLLELTVIKNVCCEPQFSSVHKG